MSLVNLQNLALNILKETKHSAIQNIDVTELPPCKLCENKILSVNFESFTILSCGHIYHKKLSERRFSESSSQSSGTSALADMLGDDLGLGSLMAVSPLLGQKDPYFMKVEHKKKRIIESPDKSDKRQKSATKEGESSIVKKLIKELKDDSVNKDLAQSKVDKEVKDQLPKEVNDTTRWKQTERAKKIYELFIEIGFDKMERVKSYSALTISKLSWESIDYCR
ncbi:hypothetical protein C2G38_2184907 [Gigaspora rosea]|uniref:Uncharacterized protein n=1 Tax=Gigaspora rosea TaxID=44941 RepID=A0A397V8R8_9GLOM|nr:hypothetical protein C2G38_2184907 [Gigaspora rosea]